MDHPEKYGITNTKDPCAGRAIFDQDPTPVADPSTYFFYHEGHPSTAVHRAVGKMLYEELAAHLAAATNH
jgi:phospholipase/lecithinase/hemolysin